MSYSMMGGAPPVTRPVVPSTVSAWPNRTHSAPYLSTSVPIHHRTSLPSAPKRIGILHTYDPAVVDKLVHTKAERQEVLMDEEPFAAGGVCQAFRVRLVGPDGRTGPLQVAKRYKMKFGFLDDYVHTQMGKTICDKFNDAMKRHSSAARKVSFLSWHKVLELDNHFYSLEDFLPGQFIKYNNIFGDVELAPMTAEEQLCNDLAAAFSHFSFVTSGFNYVILDVQGVGTTFTDIAIVSRTQSQYGYTDTGPTAMQAFCKKHQCNSLCRKLGLPALGEELPQVREQDKPAKEAPAPPSKTQWEFLDENHYSYPFSEDLQKAITLAAEKGVKVKVCVGDFTHHIIDPSQGQLFSILNGQTKYVHNRRTTTRPREHCALQVLLDDGEWHTYSPEIQQAVMKAVDDGQSTVTVSMNGRNYDVDLQALTQRNSSNNNVRKVRFVVFQNGAEVPAKEQ